MLESLLINMKDNLKKSFKVSSKKYSMIKGRPTPTSMFFTSGEIIWYFFTLIRAQSELYHLLQSIKIASEHTPETWFSK